MSNGIQHTQRLCQSLDISQQRFMHFCVCPCITHWLRSRRIQLEKGGCHIVTLANHSVETFESKYDDSCGLFAYVAKPLVTQLCSKHTYTVFMRRISWIAR